MPEIIPFAVSVPTFKKNRASLSSERSPITSQAGSNHASTPTKHLSQLQVSSMDSVHFSGTKRKREQPPPASSGSDTEPLSSDNESRPPQNKPPRKPHGNPEADFLSLLLNGTIPSQTSASHPFLPPGAAMQAHIQELTDDTSAELNAYRPAGKPYSDKLHEILSRSYLNNALLKGDDPQLKKAILQNLKTALGPQQPIYTVDCAPKNLKQLEQQYLEPALPKVFSEPAGSLGLPGNQPTVLVLNNVSAPDLESLRRHDAFQRIKAKNPHFRFIISQPADKANPIPAGANPIMQLMLGGPSPHDEKAQRPAPFETVNVHPLSPSQWSQILPKDKQFQDILNHWKLQFPQNALKEFLTTLQRSKPSPLDQAQILEEVDTLASGIRIRNKDASHAVTSSHIKQASKNWPIGTPATSTAANNNASSNPMEQKPYKIIQSSDIKTRLSDVVGNQRAKDILSEALEAAKYPNLYRHLNEGDEDAQSNYVLLAGSPGGGKTMLARAIAGEGKGTFISTSGSEFVNVFVGMGANNMRQLEAAIENAPDDLVVVFMDEIDSLGKRGGKNPIDTSGSGEDTKTINQFLKLTEGIHPNKKKILLIGATNYPEHLDEALMSRFHYKINIEKPTTPERKTLLEKQMSQKKLVSDGSVDLEQLAKNTNDFSGRDLRNIMKITKAKLFKALPTKEKERLENDPEALKKFQFQVSQSLLLKTIQEIKTDAEKAKQATQPPPPPEGMYI